LAQRRRGRKTSWFSRNWNEKEKKRLAERSQRGKFSAQGGAGRQPIGKRGKDTRYPEEEKKGPSSSGVHSYLD